MISSFEIESETHAINFQKFSTDVKAIWKLHRRFVAGCVILVAGCVKWSLAEPVTASAPVPASFAATNPVSVMTAIPDAAATAVPDAHLDYPSGRAPKFWSVAAAETVRTTPRRISTRGPMSTAMNCMDSNCFTVPLVTGDISTTPSATLTNSLTRMAIFGASSTHAARRTFRASITWTA